MPPSSKNFGIGLSFIINQVGVLSFINVILTGTLIHKRELSTLHPIGMMDIILVCERLYYTLLVLERSLTAGQPAWNTIISIF